MPTRRTLHMSPPAIAEALAAQGDVADSYVTDDESASEAGYRTGRLAYFQYVLAQAAQLAEAEAERLVMDGIPVDTIARGLTDHGLDNVTPDLLRAGWPLVIVAEQRVQWMRDNAPDYLPLLHAVATFVANRWAGLTSPHRAEAQGTALLLVDRLRQLGTTDLTDLAELEPHTLMVFAPHRLAWLSYLTPDLATDDASRHGITALLVRVRRYYGKSAETADAIGSLPPPPFPADTAAALRETVTNPADGDAVLYTAYPVA